VLCGLNMKYWSRRHFFFPFVSLDVWTCFERTRSHPRSRPLADEASALHRPRDRDPHRRTGAPKGATIGGEPNPKPIDYTMTRDKFEQLNQALFLRCLETVKRVLKVTPNERTTEADNIWADDRIQYQDLF
jgi:hypothetical protein